MLEARAFVSEINTARKILEKKKAIFKGEYMCWDTIYSPTKINKTLKDEFLRLRVNKKNIWNEKDVVLAVKKSDGSDGFSARIMWREDGELFQYMYFGG